MFLCNDCHDDTCPGEFIEDLGRSRGPCEVCESVANCYDCRGYRRLWTTTR